MASSSCPQNVHWINDSFQPSSLLSFFLPFLSLLSIHPSFLPLRPSLFFHHPTSIQFLLPFLPRACKVQSIKRFLDKGLKNFSVCPLETYQDIFYLQALKKKINFGLKFLLREKSSQRKSMATIFSINGYWIRLYCFLPE